MTQSVNIGIDFYICVVASVIWVLTVVFYLLSIKKEKARILSEGKTVPQGDKRLISCVAASFLVLVLPYAIYFKPYITFVLEGCAVLGSVNVLKERLSELKSI